VSAHSTRARRPGGSTGLGLAGAILAVVLAAGCATVRVPSFSACPQSQCAVADDSLVAAVRTSVSRREPQQGGKWGLVALRPPSASDAKLMQAARQCAAQPQAFSVEVESVANPRFGVLAFTYRLLVWTDGIAVCHATRTDEVTISTDDWLRVINGSMEHGHGRFTFFAQPGSFRVELL
jgi:hypothetical protein